MEKFIINGGKILKGDVLVSGSKNAATPILASSLLSREPSVIRNLPLIEDVFRLLEMIESLGAKVEWLNNKAVKISFPRQLDLRNFKREIATKLRSSILLIGPLAARYSNFSFPEPGGCIIGKRPIDSHLAGFNKFGVKTRVKNKEIVFKKTLPNEKMPNSVVLPEFSVTATENLMMLAASLPGKSFIKCAAEEPHVQELADSLNKRGAKVKLRSGKIFEITGNSVLKGIDWTIPPDPLEAITFSLVFVLTGGEGSVGPVNASYLDLVLLKMEEAGIRFEIKSNNIIIKKNKDFLKAFNLKTMPYPGFPTDLQALFGLLATQANGESIIHDTLYENRFKYFQELKKMGAKFEIADPHRIFVKGPVKLKGRNIESFDLRAGATLILAGLIAKGRTVIKNIYQVDRGYERIDEKLRKIGADITRS